MLRWRINFILINFLLLGAVLISQLFYLQIIKGDFYKALAQGLFGVSQDQRIKERGEIFFRNGEALAVNITWPLIFASPIEVKEKEITAEKLASILSLNKEDILEKLKKDNFYEVIKKRITPEERQKIQELNLKGIYWGEEKGRYYPQEDFASQLVGFVDTEGQGQYGLESYYNEILYNERTQKNQNIVLTVDYAIQFQAEKLLKEAKEKLNIESGEIVVVDPKTGEILALANFPNFNPNKYSLVTDFDIFKNSVTQKLFEPGSMFKTITMAAALEEGKITPETTYIDNGFVKVGGWTIYNYGKKTWGERTMTQVLEYSINTGAIFAEQKLGHNNFLKYFDKFGFSKPTNVDLPEIYSENKEFKKGYEVNFVTASFGQGIEITPLQLITAYTVLANNGKLVRPFIVKKIISNDEIKEIKPETTDELIISPKTANQVTAMLVSVVKNGSAKLTQIPGYYIAGKTGTAQISWSALGIEKKGYSEKTWQSFIGFAPAFNPRFLILVKLTNPETKSSEYSAVPIFKELAKYLIDYWQIPPDY
ncbi:MAG: peptidoglycan D,D-transpeptidase FtsI family protein [Minisyncoccales bacterium]